MAQRNLLPNYCKQIVAETGRGSKIKSSSIANFDRNFTIHCVQEECEASTVVTHVSYSHLLANVPTVFVKLIITWFVGSEVYLQPIDIHPVIDYKLLRVNHLFKSVPRLIKQGYLWNKINRPTV